MLADVSVKPSNTQKDFEEVAYGEFFITYGRYLFVKAGDTVGRRVTDGGLVTVSPKTIVRLPTKLTVVAEV